MIKRTIDILGLCETRWQLSSDFNSDEFRIKTSGSDSQEHRRVAIIMKETWASNIVNTLYVNERLLLIKMKTQMDSLIILQVYFSTLRSTEEELENMYDKIEYASKITTKGDGLIIMEDFNAIIDERYDDRGERNSV